MLIILLAVQAITLIALIALLFRKPATATADPRLAQLLAADLPSQLTRLDANFTGLDNHLRGELSQLRTEVLVNINTLGETLRTGLEGFRADNNTSADKLRLTVDAQLSTLTQRFAAFTSDINSQQAASREALHKLLTELGAAQTDHQEKLRNTVEQKLEALNTTNAAKLEEMRQTVDEKLHATLQTRLTESFGAVTDQLTKVHTGLGEMTKLSAGVDDLSRIFTNVKSRGSIGEVLLGTLLKQMLAPSQFQQNVKVKPNSAELVEYAVKFPTPHGDTLLPIDAKFPREAWERLETAYEHGSAPDIASAGRAFETAIRTEGKRISDKYIAPPATTSFAIMFLPTEGLYAEVMRRDGLQSDIQQNCRVTIAGPSTLSAILSSFQMGFHMLELQEKGDEVWKVLANARTQFGKFEDLMGKMSTDVEKVQKTIGDVATRTRAINRTLRDVSVDTSETALPTGNRGSFDGVLPMLAANEDD
jgi:DNA recombination protein RmuC